MKLLLRHSAFALANKIVINQSINLSLSVECPRGTLGRTLYSAKSGFSQSITGSTRQISSRHHSQSTRQISLRHHSHSTRQFSTEHHSQFTRGISQQSDINYHTKALTLLFCSARA